MGAEPVSLPTPSHLKPPGPGTDLALATQVLDHRDPAVAAAICSVLLPAYAQEALLLGVQHFAPLKKTAADVQASPDFHLGVVHEDQLLGVLSIGPDEEAQALCINMLVVHPQAQRQGIGRRLVQEALQRGPGMAFEVSTGAKNAPALALYEQFGFVIYRHGTVGPEQLPLVKLRRPATP